MFARNSGVVQFRRVGVVKGPAAKVHRLVLEADFVKANIRSRMMTALRRIRAIQLVQAWRRLMSLVLVWQHRDDETGRRGQLRAPARSRRPILDCNNPLKSFASDWSAARLGQPTPLVTRLN